MSYGILEGVTSGGATFSLLRKMQVQGVKSVLPTFPPYLTEHLQSEITSLGAPVVQALPSYPEGDGMPGVLLDSPLKEPGRRIQKGTYWRPGKLTSSVRVPLAYLEPLGEQVARPLGRGPRASAGFQS